MGFDKKLLNLIEKVNKNYGHRNYRLSFERLYRGTKMLKQHLKQELLIFPKFCRPKANLMLTPILNRGKF